MFSALRCIEMYWNMTCEQLVILKSIPATCMYITWMEKTDLFNWLTTETDI